MIDQNTLYSECPCGSGKKFKFCCYPAVRSELPVDPSRTDVIEAIRRRSIANRVSERMGGAAVVDLDRFHELIDRGLRHLHSGEYEAAKIVLLRAREEFDRLPTAYNDLALCALVQGNLEEAERWINEVVRRFPAENPFGLAMLADIHYLKGDSLGALEAIDRAERIEPPSADHAVRVCESMAHFMDHGRIIRYVEKSGFDDDPELSLFYGVALANSGRREEAARALRIAKGGNQPEYVERILAEVTGERPPSTICGDWMYFTPDSFTIFAGLLENIQEESPEQRMDLSADAIAELIEVETNGGVLDPITAVTLLSSSVGKRSERVLNALRTNAEFPESVRAAAEKAYAGIFAKDGLGRRLRKIDEGSMQKMILSEDVATCEPLDPALEKIYRKALEIYMDPKSVRSDVEKVFRMFEDLYARAPDNPKVVNNYAAVLAELGRFDEAFEMVKDCFARHPEYVFGAANYLSQLIQSGRMEEANALIDNYHLPQRIHPMAYVAWMKSELVFYKQTGDKKRARNVQNAIKRVQTQFELYG